MIQIVADVAGVAMTHVALNALLSKTERQAVVAATRTAARAVEAIRAGAPVDEGIYVGTIEASPVRMTADGPYVRVSSDAPQARRLELGYVGPDSLGRIFNHVTLPNPHFGPVAPLILGWLAEEMRRA